MNWVEGLKAVRVLTEMLLCVALLAAFVLPVAFLNFPWWIVYVVCAVFVVVFLFGATNE